MSETILFSVAHSSAASGAMGRDGVMKEYMVSLRATLAAVRNLMGEIPVALYDCGPLPVNQYDDAKVSAVNALKPKLAIEIHCNSAENQASYGEVLHHRDSKPGKLAAESISSVIADAFSGGRQLTWRQKGARANTVEQDKHLLFFLERTVVPCVIVEAVFISNLEQAKWLAEGGMEAYGLLVAEGVRKFLGRQL